MIVAPQRGQSPCFRSLARRVALPRLTPAPLVSPFFVPVSLRICLRSFPFLPVSPFFARTPIAFSPIRPLARPDGGALDQSLPVLQNGLPHSSSRPFVLDGVQLDTGPRRGPPLPGRTPPCGDKAGVGDRSRCGPPTAAHRCGRAGRKALVRTRGQPREAPARAGISRSGRGRRRT